MAWTALALLAVWFVAPFAVMFGSSLLLPGRLALQETRRLYLLGAGLGLCWFALLAIPLAAVGGIRWTPKILGGAIGWSVLAGVLLASPVLALLNGCRSGDAGVATMFERAGGYRQQIRLRALDGPAAGQTFRTSFGDVDGHEVGPSRYTGRVHHGRLVWWASFRR